MKNPHSPASPHEEEDGDVDEQAEEETSVLWSPKLAREARFFWLEVLDRPLLHDELQKLDADMGDSSEMLMSIIDDASVWSSLGEEWEGLILRAGLP